MRMKNQSSNGVQKFDGDQQISLALCKVLIAITKAIKSADPLMASVIAESLEEEIGRSGTQDGTQRLLGQFLQQLRTPSASEEQGALKRFFGRRKPGRTSLGA